MITFHWSVPVCLVILGFSLYYLIRAAREDRDTPFGGIFGFFFGIVLLIFDVLLWGGLHWW